jgi:hypothetical protein
MSASIIVLIALTGLVAVLAVYRKVVARNEDDLVHLSDPSGQLIQNQQKVAKTLSHVDRFGIGLTVATAVYGVALGAIYLYTGLMQNGRM